MTYISRRILMIIFCATPAFAAREHLMNFDQDKAGGPPQGWVSDGDNWLVAAEAQASSAPHVLTPPHSVLAGGSLSNLLISSATFSMGDVGMRFRTTREDPPVVFGLVWSYVNESNYEEVQINTQSGNMSFISVRKGKSHELAADSIMFTPNTWHLLQVQAGPKQLSLYLDNEVILSTKTSLRKNAGKVGICVTPNSPIQFDDFAWRSN